MKKLMTILMAVLFLAMGTQYAQAGVSIPPNTHWKCYSVVGNAPSPTETVTLEDQFSLSTETVRRPRLICNPVDKNGEDTDETDVHLTCYETVSPTRLNPVPRVQVSNQFVDVQTLQVVDNPLALSLVPNQGVTGTTGFTPQGQTVRSSHLLCVPSSKTCINTAGQTIPCPNDLCAVSGGPGWGNMVHPGGGLLLTADVSPQACCLACVANPACTQWAMPSGGQCQLNVPPNNQCTSAITSFLDSGIIRCP